MNPTRLTLGLILISAPASLAVITVGPGGRGVTAGNSSLIGTYDYSDSFTGFDSGGTNSARVYAPALQPAAAYAVQNTYTHPAANFQTQGQAVGVAAFSFAADSAGTPGLVLGSPAYPGTSGAGSATGFTQTGGNIDYGVPYGFRSRYVVQFDAMASNDRIDISTGSLPGTIGAGNLSIFIRANGTGNVSLYNGAVDTPLGFNTGLANDGQWHNFAALFDVNAQTIQIFIDEVSKGVISVPAVAGGIYAGFTNQFVGVGMGLGTGQNRSWTDNFQVGAPIPEPSSSLLVLGAGALACVARRKRGESGR